MALRHALLALLALGAAMRPAHAQSGGDASCAAATAATLELPACRGVKARVAAATGAAAEDQPCLEACGGLRWRAGRRSSRVGRPRRDAGLRSDRGGDGGN